MKIKIITILIITEFLVNIIVCENANNSSSSVKIRHDNFDIMLNGLTGKNTMHPHPKGKFPEFIERLKNGDFKHISFLLGAGASTSAGIPDFRSEDGLFNILQKKYNLSSPMEFFNIESFYKTPKNFYDFSKNFQPEKYKPTIFHHFIGFINSKNLLQYVFTQNIDGLELKIGIDNEKIVFAHGNLFEAHCPKCGTDKDFQTYKDHYLNDKIMYCEKCGSPIKSKVVFYGEGLSDRFFDKSVELFDADLVIFCGTSLEVAPFNKLAYSYINSDAYRVVINKIQVGKTMAIRGFQYYDENSNDIFMSGTCDDQILNIVDKCGWKKEFENYLKNFDNNQK